MLHFLPMTRVSANAAIHQHDQPLWRNTSFMLMWSSVAASGFGDRLIQLAAWSMLGVHVAGTDAASVQAGVSFFFFLPYVVLGPAAGWLADTLPRKWLMLFCDEARAGVLLLACLLAPAGAAAAVGTEHHWKVFFIIASVGVLAALFSPAKASVIPQIVPTRHLQPANAIVLGLAVIASLIGFQIGGPIIEQQSVRSALMVGALSFGVSGLFFAFLKPRPHTGHPIRHRPSQVERFIEAVRYVRQHRPIWQLIGLSVVFWSASMVLLAAIAALCKTAYGVDESRVISHTTTMMAMLGAGMLASSLCVAWANSRRESAWFVMLALAIAGLCMLGVAVSRQYTVSLVLVFATGFWGNAAMICVATLTQSIAPDYIRGRVFGVRDLLNTLSAVLVNLAIWRLPDADQYMVTTLYVVAGTLTVIALVGLVRQLISGPLETAGQNLLWRVCRAYVLVWHRLQWVGRQHIPERGRVILAANHTTGLDPFLIQAVVRRPIAWVMLRHFRYRMLEVIWRIVQPITVEEGGNQVGQLRQMLRALNDDTVLGIFPEGAAQRDNRELKAFQPGIGLLAKRSGAAIVPIWITGTPRARHLLWHFFKPSRSTVIFGPAVHIDPGLTAQQVTDLLRQLMLDLSHLCGHEPQQPNHHLAGDTSAKKNVG